MCSGLNMVIYLECFPEISLFWWQQIFYYLTCMEPQRATFKTMHSSMESAEK